MVNIWRRLRDDEGTRLLAMLVEVGAVEISDGTGGHAVIQALNAILERDGSESRRTADIIRVLIDHDEVSEIYVDDDKLRLLLEQW